MARNLISVSTAVKCGVKVIFEGFEGLVMRGDKVLAKAKEVGNLYYIPIFNKLPNIVGDESSSYIAENQQVAARNEAELWHFKMGHISSHRLAKFEWHSI